LLYDDKVYSHSARECRQRLVERIRGCYLQHLTFLPVDSLVWGSRRTTATPLRALPLGSISAVRSSRLVRNAPHTWNVSPTYDRGRVSIRVGLSYNAQNIAAMGRHSWAIRRQLLYPTFSSMLRVASKCRGLSFVMYGSTSTTRSSVSTTEPQYMLQREFYKPTIAAVSAGPRFMKK